MTYAPKAVVHRFSKPRMLCTSKYIDGQCIRPQIHSARDYAWSSECRNSLVVVFAIVNKV